MCVCVCKKRKEAELEPGMNFQNRALDIKAAFGEELMDFPVKCVMHLETYRYQMVPFFITGITLRSNYVP